eukprot:1234398-Prymnesium_polylepis.1
MQEGASPVAPATAEHPCARARASPCAHAPRVPRARESAERAGTAVHNSSPKGPRSTVKVTRVRAK